MALYLETLAFALLIGGQFLAAIVLISKRASIYGAPMICSTSSRPRKTDR
jgi:hypothetical protein